MKLFKWVSCMLMGMSLVTVGQAATLVVYGGSGHIGSRIVTEALSRGHTVTVISRQQSSQSQPAGKLNTLPGDILDTKQVASTIAGKDVVIVAVNNSEAKFFTDAAQSVTGAMRSLGARSPRLIWVGGASSLDSAPGKRLIDATPGIGGARLGHAQVLDFLRAQKDLRWTVATPSLEIPAGQRTGKFRVGGDLVLKDGQGKSSISMEDFAVAVIDEVERQQYIGKRFTVGY